MLSVGPNRPFMDGILITDYIFEKLFAFKGLEEFFFSLSNINSNFRERSCSQLYCSTDKTVIIICSRDLSFVIAFFS